MRTIIAGSRECHHYHIVCQAIEEAGWEITTVISGCARGVDTFGEQYAAEHGIPVERHPADWENLGRKAGPIRNHVMAQCADALIAVLYPGSRGTENMIQQARDAGLKHIYIKYFEKPSNDEKPSNNTSQEQKQ